MLAYQKAVYRQIAGMQSAAGLTPWVQYGEFLWWYFAGASGMGYYDAETVAAAAAPGTGLGRALAHFPHAERRSQCRERWRRRDLPAQSSAGLRGRARGRHPLRLPHRDVRSALAVRRKLPDSAAHRGRTIESVRESAGRVANEIVQRSRSDEGGSARLRHQPAESQSGAGGHRALPFFRLAAELSDVPGSGVRLGHTLDTRTLPGSSAGIATANLWALDHVCLYNLTVPERHLERRSVAKT